VNKRFSKFRITDIGGIANKFIKKSSHSLGNNAFYLLFDDNTFFTVHAECGDLYFDFPLTVHDYKNIGLINDKEFNEYVEKEIQSRKDSYTAHELKELQRLKEKYEGENNEGQ